MCYDVSYNKDQHVSICLSIRDSKMEGAPTKILGRANLRLKTRERIYEMVSIKVISVYFREKFRYAVEDSYPKETRWMKPCTGKVDFLTCLSHRFTNFPLTAL